MRQRLSEKKVEKLRKQLDLPIHHVLVRGGTDHRKELVLEDGRIIVLRADGTTQNFDSVQNFPGEFSPKNGPADLLT